MRGALRCFAVALAAGAILATAAPARAEMGEPDPSYREAQQLLREAARDTLDHPGEPGRLDALASALLKLARFDDAQRQFVRVLAARPDDPTALAGLGRIALCRQDDATAESLLTRARGAEGSARDLYSLTLRRHDWRAAAEMAEANDEPGRREMLERLAGLEQPALTRTGAERAVLPFARAWPVPLVRVTLGGQTVLMAVDPGSAELLLDPQAARLAHVTLVGGERPVAWMGSRVAGHDALVSRLGLGHIELHDVPASVTNLHRYSLEVNPEGEALGGVIGLSVLERFGVTIDFRDQVLELRPLGETPTAKAEIVPFERWGESELMVRGSLEGGRRMAFWLGTGLPEAAVGAPQATFDEAGVRAGKFANFVRGVGSMLSGTPWTQVMASTLAVGPVVRDHAEGWSGAMDPGEMWRHGMRRDGILGPRFFTGRRVTFDWARHELRFESR